MNKHRSFEIPTKILVRLITFFLSSEMHLEGDIQVNIPSDRAPKLYYSSRQLVSETRVPFAAWPPQSLVVNKNTVFLL